MMCADRGASESLADQQKCTASGWFIHPQLRDITHETWGARSQTLDDSGDNERGATSLQRRLWHNAATVIRVST